MLILCFKLKPFRNFLDLQKILNAVSILISLKSLKLETMNVLLKIISILLKTTNLLKILGVILTLITFTSILLNKIANAKDFGIQGKVYRITEVNILEAIKESLTPEVVEAFQRKQKQESIKKIYRPTGIILPSATEFRSYTYNPAITLKQDLKDQKGRVFKRKGDILNPLHHVSLNQTLIFINGDNKEQV